MHQSRTLSGVRFLVWILSFCMSFLSFSANAQVQNIGAVTSWERTENGIQGQTASAWFRVGVVNEKVVRVRVSLEEEMEDFSYVLVEQAADREKNFTLREEEGAVFLSTGMMEIEVETEPAFRVTVRNNEGQVISEDKAGEGFGTVFTGRRTNLYKVLHTDERFVGLGEVLGDLDKRGGAFTLNNTDTYRYGDPRLPMYVSIPFYIGMHDSLVYGLFYHNTYKTFFNFGVSTPGFTSITADGGDVDYFLIYDVDIAGILHSYTDLTGRMPMPPRWSLGYHQSRCSYFPEENVKILAQTFRARQIPIDCIVLDADYLQDYEPFRINTQRFPDLSGLTAFLKELDMEVTASVNPGIKLDSTYFAYLDGLKKDVFLKFSDGSLYTADIAPSTNHFVDFTSAEARKWWIDNMKFLPENGIHGYWNDMNEPAVGASYLPDNLVFDFDGHKAGALQAKNLYGMLMARSSYESALRYGGNRRPFVLTRSGFAGVQRYAAVWTGDNTARDEYLLGGALLNTQLGLSGLPFVGDDIGGYIGHTSKELFTRWIEAGVFEPFARNHKEAFSLSNEPWAYGEEAEAIAREYIGFRYRLLPYLYSTFWKASQSGLPVVRSLCINDPYDGLVYDRLYQYQFLCGDAIMVVPVTPSEKLKKFYLPGGMWYDLFTDEKYAGGKELGRECAIYEIPLFIRESSVIPMQSLVQSTGEKPSDTLFVHVYQGSRKSVFEYYEDDGSTMDYLEGAYCRRDIEFDPVKKEIRFGESEGSYTSMYSVIKLVLHGFDLKNQELTISKTKVAVKQERLRLLDGLRYLEGIYDPGYFRGLREEEKRGNQETVSFPWSDEEITVGWK